jgi:hypothetical protein
MFLEWLGRPLVGIFLLGVASCAQLRMSCVQPGPSMISWARFKARKLPFTGAPGRHQPFRAIDEDAAVERGQVIERVDRHAVRDESAQHVAMRRRKVMLRLLAVGRGASPPTIVVPQKEAGGSFVRGPYLSITALAASLAVSGHDFTISSAGSQPTRADSLMFGLHQLDKFAGEGMMPCRGQDRPDLGQISGSARGHGSTLHRPADPPGRPAEARRRSGEETEVRNAISGRALDI